MQKSCFIPKLLFASSDFETGVFFLYLPFTNMFTYAGVGIIALKHDKFYQIHIVHIRRITTKGFVQILGHVFVWFYV